MNIRKNRITAYIIILWILMLCGCQTVGHAKDATFESAFANGQEDKASIYVSTATVVFKSANKEEQVMDLYLKETGEDSLFYYDGATMITDKYGNSMTVDQLVAGDVGTISYNADLRKIGSLTLSTDVWMYENLEKYSINLHTGIVNVGDSTYNLSPDVQIFSGSYTILPEQLLKDDVITIKGVGHTIHSISVDRGHGYLELVKDEVMVGGWIEIGQTVISQIEPGMLFTVPEGTYQVRLTTTGVEEVREITIHRNEITELDAGNIEIPLPENGIVTFDIVPKNATVFVDGKLISQGYSLRLPLGLHQFTAQAPGYDTVSTYFNLESSKAKVQLVLSESTGTISGNGLKSGDGTITIASPDGAEVYEDNLYKGLVPVTYTKTPGTHVITLRKAGYIPTSYTIELTDDSEDVVYAFAELMEDGTNGISGNSISGNGLSPSPTATVTPTPSISPTPTATPTNNPPSDARATATPRIASPTPLPTVTPMPTAVPEPTATLEPTPAITPTPEAFPTVEPTQIPVPTEEASPTEAPVEESSPLKEPEEPKTEPIVIIDLTP